MIHLPDDELIGAYFDGELSGEELARAEHLVATRPECRQLFDELTALRGSLQSLPREQLGPGFAENVLRRAELEMLQPRRPSAEQAATTAGRASRGATTISWRRWRRPLAWSAVAAAAALLVMMFSPQEPAIQVAVRPDAPRANEQAEQMARHDAIDGERRGESPMISAAPPAYSAFEDPSLADNTALFATMDGDSPVVIIECNFAAGEDGARALREAFARQGIAWQDELSRAKRAAGSATRKMKTAGNASSDGDERGGGEPKAEFSDEAVYVVAQQADIDAALASLTHSGAVNGLEFHTAQPHSAARSQLGVEPAPPPVTAPAQPAAGTKDRQAESDFGKSAGETASRNAVMPAAKPAVTKSVAKAPAEESNEAVPEPTAEPDDAGKGKQSSGSALHLSLAEAEKRMGISAESLQQPAPQRDEKHPVPTAAPEVARDKQHAAPGEPPRPSDMPAQAVEAEAAPAKNRAHSPPARVLFILRSAPK